MEIAAWIGCLFFLVAGWNQVEQFLDRRTRRGASRDSRPSSPMPAKFDRPVLESLCRSRRDEAGIELARLDRELENLRRERREEVGELQQKVNKVDREVGELRASMALNHQQLLRIDAKLDRVIERENP